MKIIDNWETSHLKHAYLASLRSKHFSHREGACLVDKNNRMLSIGYNGLPRGINPDQVFGVDNELGPGFFEISAGRNAIFNAIRQYVEGSDLYVGYSPCNTCTQAIIQTGVKRVKYYSDRHLTKRKPYAVAAQLMIDAVNSDGQIIDVRKYTGREKLTLEDSVTWEEKHMHTAGIAAMRSKDPTTQVGACLVNGTTEVATGYNGFPEVLKGCNIPWTDDNPKAVHSKHGYVVHAEENTLLNTSLGDIAGSTIYLTHFPDMKTMQTILQARVAKMVYVDDNKRLEKDDSDKYEASKEMARLAEEMSKNKNSNLSFEFQKVDFDLDKLVFDLTHFT